MKKISLLTFYFVFIAAASSAEQINEVKEIVIDKAEKPISSGDFIKPQTEPLMAAGPVDGKCPVIGYRYFGGKLIFQYPPSTVDPDCPPR